MCPNGKELVNDECLPVCKPGYTRQEGRCSRLCPEGSTFTDGQCRAQPLDCGPGEVDRDGECVSICNEDTCGQGSCEVEGTSYRCICDEGYETDGRSCSDVDECKRDSSLCPRGQCVNTEGSFYCHCEGGYRNEDGVCVDINECEEGVICSQQCTNTEGSYECGCWEGYIPTPGTSGSCTDIDECRLKPAICEQGCRNLAGGFECTCDSGFRMHPADETKCLRDGCQPLEAPTGGKLSCTPGELLAGSECKLMCRKGFMSKGKTTRTCLENGEWEEGAGWCEKPACQPLPPVENGFISPESCLTQEHDFKQRCIVSCRDGYTLRGSYNIICRKRGRWMQRQGKPTCVPNVATVAKPDRQIPPPTPARVATTTMPSTPPVSPYIICPPDILVNLTEPLPFQVAQNLIINNDLMLTRG